MGRSLQVVIALTLPACMLAVVACSGSDAAPRTSGVATQGGPGSARPPGLPSAARPIESDYNLKTPSASPLVAPAEVFYALHCQDGLLTIATTRVVLYAELSCDRSPADEVVRPFLARAVQLRVKVGAPAKLFVDSSSAGSIEFTVGSVWIESVSS